ncbi:DUF2934 domain-containing protein [Polaromonas sp.]|uniref:DUF2934 domain-containing protein n=1 Tax=Polaromonas sp. TaxID=1869339 RepID=UPI00352B323E
MDKEKKRAASGADPVKESLKRKRAGAYPKAAALAGNARHAPTAISLSREERVRIAAYLASEKRGFEPGMAEADWLEAERQVDSEQGQPDVAG